jgi:LmbE family N-acetylglucosaminyl deacetylase
MCVSAHPDDENGATLAYYTHIKRITAYSIFYTRGEGGQNVIGPELYDELGEMRAEETLTASKILGTQAYFLSFPDFGFSKTAKETFRMWGGEDSVLSRIVYMIRALKPDVIITNHDTITTLPYRQHGNHQAVGITIYEAFDKAADPAYHPEQFRQGLAPWRVKKLFFRVFRESDLKKDSLVTIPSDTKYGMEIIQQIAWDALKKHRTQGLDKLDFTKLPGPFKQVIYQLVRSDKKYPYDPYDLFSGIKPSSRRTAVLPERYAVPLKPFSIFVSPKYSLIPVQPNGNGTYELTYHLDTFNHTGKYVDFSIIVNWRGKRLYVEHQELQPAVRDEITINVEVPTAVAADDSLVINAVPHLEESIPGLAATNDVVYLKSVFARFDSSDYIGLVNTYDNTLQETFDSFGIKYQLIDSAALASETLGKFTTIVLDIRAYLYRRDLARYNDRILDYIMNGGNVVCFYDRPQEWNGHNFAPYPIDVTGQRVTEENQPVTVLDPENRLFHYPNQIVASDWNGWVQERNIYLPDGDTTKTSAKYERLLAMSDEDEAEPPTSLLWGQYGKGTYVYTSLALYRQVKNLNNGAVKLLFNLISQTRH